MKISPSARRNGTLVHVITGFDYETLKDPSLATKIRSTAKELREKIKRTLVDIIEVGCGLLMVKDNLGHGQFGRWLLAEFGWTDRTARNFMAVAEQFGTKTEMISDLAIEPTAAYLLAAPSVSFEARQAALDRAQAGEKITATVAKEILGSDRKKTARIKQTLEVKNKWQRLAKVLKTFREECELNELGELARQLKRFITELEKGKAR